jgi:branched-subunit amino acid ABC-type transport system permease component
MVYGVLRLINFAHSEVFMWGSFAAVWVLMAVGAGKASGLGLAGYLVIGFVAAMTVSALIAMLLERVAYRPLRKRNSPPLIALISAIGASFALSELMGLRDKPLGWFNLEIESFPTRPRKNSTGRLCYGNPADGVCDYQRCVEENFTRLGRATTGSHVAGEIDFELPVLAVRSH